MFSRAAMRVGGQAIQQGVTPFFARRLADGVEKKTQLPLELELKITRELREEIDDRVALRLEKFATKDDLQKWGEKLEANMKADLRELKKDMKEDLKGVKEDLKGVKDDLKKCVTKEDLQEELSHLGTRMMNYFLVSTGSLMITGVGVAARAGFFQSPPFGRIPRYCSCSNNSV